MDLKSLGLNRTNIHKVHDIGVPKNSKSIVTDINTICDIIVYIGKLNIDQIIKYFKIVIPPVFHGKLTLENDKLKYTNYIYFQKRNRKFSFICHNRVFTEKFEEGYQKIMGKINHLIKDIPNVKIDKIAYKKKTVFINEYNYITSVDGIIYYVCYGKCFTDNFTENVLKRSNMLKKIDDFINSNIKSYCNKLSESYKYINNYDKMPQELKNFIYENMKKH